jgi:hypothetical protein
MLLSRHGPGLAKSGHIINAVPDILELQYGSTMAVWLVAPIPRSIWPGKPLIHSGPILGALVFDSFANGQRTGVPPGLFAELYWNFHLPGVVLGCFMLGWLLRSLHGRLAPRRGNRSLTLIYVLGPMGMGFNFMWVGVGYGFLNATINAAVVTVLILVVSVGGGGKAAPTAS